MIFRFFLKKSCFLNSVPKVEDSLVDAAEMLHFMNMNMNQGDQICSYKIILDV